MKIRDVIVILTYLGILGFLTSGIAGYYLTSSPWSFALWLGCIPVFALSQAALDKFWNA